jgi:hypothetical protein
MKNNTAAMESISLKEITDDFEHHFSGSNLKGFIASTAPIDAMQPF